MRLSESRAHAQWSMLKNAIKREQSQACLGYAEREHFRRSQWPMLKNAIKREQSQACLGYAEREHFRRSQWSMVNGQWSMIKHLAHLHASVAEGSLHDVHALLRSSEASTTNSVVLLAVHEAGSVCDSLNVLQCSWNTF